MKKMAKTLVLSAAAAATVLISIPAAEAGPRGGWHDHRRPVVVHRHHSNRDAVALGVLGLAAGAIIGGAIADSRANQRVYIDPPQPVYRPAPNYYPPAPANSYPVTHYSYEPWTAGWYEYCTSRYRSFNPSTGTFRGYDGRDHFCVAN